MNTTTKSRDLSIFDYIEVLQEEYLCYDIRSKIYRFKDHKDYWNIVKEGKKRAITDICKRNTLPSIFTSPVEMERVGKKIYMGLCYPNFLYRDEKFRERWQDWDEKNYFSKGSDVKIELVAGTFVRGVIIQYSFETKRALVKIEGENVVREINKYQATRIM